MKKVVVIGAGPAGAAAAMNLTKFSGIEVLLLDKATFPRRKVCGSGLSPWTLELLDEMGLGDKVRQEAYPIRAGIMGGVGGTAVELRSNYEAAVLLRSRFDTILAYEAAQQGAKLTEGVRVEELVYENGRLIGVKTNQGEIEADAAIVCNGGTSKLTTAERPGNTLRSLMGWYEGVEDINDAVEIYFDPMVKPYYGWVFPESKNRVNIGICYDASHGELNAKQRFQAFIENRLANRLKYASQIDYLVGHPIAITHKPTALVQPGTLIAGEAGNLVDPATAEGIHTALASGLLAGNFLGSVLERGAEPSLKELSPYTKLIQKKIGPRLMAGNLFLQAAKTPILDLALRFGSFKSVQNTLLWVLAGA
ncbi:NAD(P)/FAD-dependent oxidoreductase [Nostoc sp. CENA67]|uniref:NAD(P)/FAD-dependent oxidoreductase n=1 Tax=Amazonocrinis nigriterrae CENA67 TaxID=2794033 RepID=A0A8J7HLN9_9NOST|nr:NAD(P)/FAD-dependent oxidoreductase [Amazonocrinis nigriterrae]MBH8561913.1 NAD(P)/FAD-dependent oxidoreductase [Amazonocrinis nigriterrae CENA67]